MTDRTFPHSLEAEAAVLGAVLIAPATAWPSVSARLRAADFYRDAHRRIFEAMSRLADRNVSIDALTLCEDLKTAGDLQEVGGPAYVMSLPDGMPRSANAEHYAAIVREHARLRTVAHATMAATQRAFEGHEPASDIAEQVTRELLEGVSGSRDPVAAGTAAEEYCARLLAGKAEPMATGYLDLDKIIGGIMPGELTVIAARPSMGKTSLALGIIDSLARAGRPCAMFSLEMTRERVSARQMAWRSGVATTDLERGLASDEDYGLASSAAGEMAGLPLVIDDDSRTMLQVSGWCRRLAHRPEGLAVAVVDYMQIVLPERANHNRQVEVASLSQALKRIGKETGAAVLALSQLSRASSARRDKRPRLADLRESGAIEQDADLVMLLHRQEEYGATSENEGIAEVIVAKNRDGPKGLARLYFDKRIARFGNLQEGL